MNGNDQSEPWRGLLADARLRDHMLEPNRLAETVRAEEALRESERRFREMIDALPAAIYTTDAEGRLTHFNPAAVEFSGREPELGTDQWCVSWKLYHPDGTPMPNDQCPMAIALKQGRAIRGAEAIAERPDGKRIWFMPYPTPLRDGNGQVVGGINMLVDITERKRTQEIHDRFAAIVESSDDAIISKDLNGIILSWNRGAERLFGYTEEEAIGQPVTILIPEGRRDEEPNILERIRRGERIDHYETVRLRKDGALLNISLTVSPIKNAQGKIMGASKIARDITERKKAEEELRKVNEELERFSMALESRVAERTAELAKTNQELLRVLAERDKLETELRQAQKMEAIGTLAGGIAHDFNNLLTIIMANAAELKNDGLRPDESSESIHAILTATRRGAAVVQQLLTFARSASVSRDNVKLDRLLGEFARLIEPIFPKTIDLCLEIQPDLPAIQANANQIQQILLNLCINSRDAMPEGGKLAISACREVRSEARAGDYVRITVADTGGGIDENIRSRIFDPFFTTKQQSGGTGLGLAVVYGIVRNHGGFIEVDSAKDKGTAFSLYFPVCPQETASEKGA